MSLQIYGIVAHPVEHSLSPIIHNALFKYYDIDARYEKFDVDKKDLPVFLDRVRKENIKGLSVSVPNKEEIMQYLDEISDVAKKIGAVNTVINKNGFLVGENTDWMGAIRAVGTGRDLSLQQKQILILGAGGAARAIVYGFKNEGANIYISNRTVEKAKKLAEEFDVNVVGTGRDLSLQPDIIINTTVLGMWPDFVDLSLFDKNSFQKGQIVMDIVYKPLMTRFLKDAEAKGCEIITGEKMLINQALEQFRIWTGKTSSIDMVLDGISEFL